MSLHYADDKISMPDYLEGEKISDIKHEYIDGRAFAMAGASKNHERIAMNLSRKLANYLENSPCDIFSSNVKVKVASQFFYPDVMVVCANQDSDLYYTEFPVYYR